MSLWQAYIEDITFSFRKQKELAEKAFSQIESEEDFFKKPGEYSNSIALIIKHLAGNLTSRWTDFLTRDGDKPWRDRDAEFIIGSEDTRASLLAAWEAGWTALFQTLGNLSEEDLLKTVTIRGEEHTVLQAIDRSLANRLSHGAGRVRRQVGEEGGVELDYRPAWQEPGGWAKV